MAKKMKKDFDKEKMYRKIMPSGEPTAESPAQESTPRGRPLTLEAPEPPAHSQRPHNYMEDMLLEKLAHTIKVLDACGCERCQKDILAIALNQMPPAYAVAEAGDDHHLKKLRGASEVKATAALIRAIQLVKQNPRH